MFGLMKKTIEAVSKPHAGPKCKALADPPSPRKPGYGGTGRKSAAYAGVCEHFSEAPQSRQRRENSVREGVLKPLLIAVVGLVLSLSVAGHAQEKQEKAPQGRPAIVVLDEVRSGQVQPMSPFVGTIFYSRVSEVAAEVDGLVDTIDFEEGQHVEKGHVLASLKTDLLDLGIAQKQALYEEAGVDLDQARSDLDRMKKLYQEKSVAYTVYDDTRFKVSRLEKRVAGLKAALARDRLMKRKMAIRAPFSGVVVDKSTEAGEWVGPGSPVATLAADREVDAVIEVPERILLLLEKDAEVRVVVGGMERSGRFEAVIPRGDISTRTFSVKLRLVNDGGLLEGMEARATLPTGQKIEGILVSRDAVVNQFGQTVIFVAAEGAAKMVPVQVLGYHDLMVGVAGPGLSAGMEVVVKGNERLRNGQPLMVQQQESGVRSQEPE